MSDRFCIVCRIFVVITGLWKSKTPANKACRGYLWRRRRDSNPRNPFGVYFGGEGGIRTLETLLGFTRFPVVRPRPG